MKKIDPLLIINQLAPMCSIAKGQIKSILQEVINVLENAPDVSEKFVSIKETHLNPNQLRSFKWEDGQLCVWFAGNHFYQSWDDPNMNLYKNLCYDLGVVPEPKPEELHSG